MKRGYRMFYLIIVLIIVFLKYKYLDYHTHDIEIHREEIYNDNIKDEVKILHLSDLHFNFDKEYQNKLLKMVNNLEYDLLVLTGDYIKKEKYIVNLDLFLSKIEDKENSFVVYGNNDHNFDLERFEEIFNQNNMNLLKNESKKLNIKNNELLITGVDTPDLKQDNLSKALDDIDLNEKVKILLSHTYHIIDREEADNFNLVLVGDTHGGQINFPGYSYIIKKFFDLKYKAGKYLLSDLILIVNKGIGTNILPYRFNCKPEVILLTLANK